MTFLRYAFSALVGLAMAGAAWLACDTFARILAFIVTGEVPR